MRRSTTDTSLEESRAPLKECVMWSTLISHTPQRQEAELCSSVTPLRDRRRSSVHQSHPSETGGGALFISHPPQRQEAELCSSVTPLRDRRRSSVHQSHPSETGGGALFISADVILIYMEKVSGINAVGKPSASSQAEFCLQSHHSKTEGGSLFINADVILIYMEKTEKSM
ncbi:Uncharacterized protein DAT39_023556 [Clarias magur]|uniref:Uncharacterized protein n=1 Tax=Clarias magur TaxID=1594786 RepID=A0A8J4T0L6_CLAMG|nr:Uncharacterized protein DAT39_023556 [Clarias magur]